MATKKQVISKIRKGEKITQREANLLSVLEYKKAKNQYRGYKKRGRK
jgi:hypothetical protein